VRTILALIVLIAAAPASAATDTPYALRGGGAATALAVDMSTLTINGAGRAAWTYHMFWRRSGSKGRRPQVLAVLQAVNCDTLLERALATRQYTATGKLLKRTGPDRGWTVSLTGSNTDYILDRMCGKADPAWAMVRAAGVFDLYRHVWPR
jgi:hypothetical protein